MSYVLLSAKNAETVIDDNCGINKFYKVANFLQDNMQVSFLNKIDDVEFLNWDFSYKSKFLTLHFDIYSGVSISESVYKNQKSLLGNEISEYLHSKAY